MTSLIGTNNKSYILNRDHIENIEKYKKKEKFSYQKSVQKNRGSYAIEYAFCFIPIFRDTTIKSVNKV